MKDYQLVINSNKEIAHKVFRAKLECQEKLPQFIGGQFLHLQLPNRILRRPLGILKINENCVEIVYAVVGEGTLELSQLKNGTPLKAMLPLGNGFILPNGYKKVALLGGGLGSVPLLPVIKTYKDIEFYAYMGFRSKDNVILYDDFKSSAYRTVYATEDGSFGEKGYALSALQNDMKDIRFDAVLVCGPTPMVKAVKNADLNVPVFVSLEERMGCGVGACLVCTCKIKKGEQIENLRVCADGPVFKLDEVVL
ncbi:MAG TPA: dihydroorotate dehydrogenase electron transfer subunit [Clostridia bacterium]